MMIFMSLAKQNRKQGAALKEICNKANKDYDYSPVTKGKEK